METTWFFYLFGPLDSVYCTSRNKKAQNKTKIGDKLIFFQNLRKKIVV